MQPAKPITIQTRLRPLASLGLIAWLSGVVLAAPPAKHPLPPLASAKPAPLSTAERGELAWLPPVVSAQQQVFAYLQAKVGHKLYRPDPPMGENYTGQWFFARQPASTDPKIVYPLIYENLLVAKKLLNSANAEDQRLGLIVARYSNLWLVQRLNDRALSPRIMEAFLLPHLEMAYAESWKTVCRRQILEDANDAYQSAGETQHQAAILKFVIHYGRDANTTDLARTQLGEALAAQGKYDQAIATVNAITAPNLIGGKLLAVGWKQQEDAQAKSKLAAPKSMPRVPSKTGPMPDQGKPSP